MSVPPDSFCYCSPPPQSAGQCHVTPACFGHLTALLRPVARLALLLEGGYNLEATAAGAEACLRALLGQRPRHLPGGR
jgi:histone deacetylase 6